MKRIPSVEHLHGLGNSQYSHGLTKEAIESFDSALRMMETESKLKEQSSFNCQELLIQKHICPTLHSHDIGLDYPPDSFFEGECDVGPRAIHSPLHINYNAMPTLDATIIMAVLLYNKGVAQHSGGNLKAAADSFGLASASLMKNWSRYIMESKAVLSCLSHIRALIHNNLGHLRYFEGDDLNALFHFETALELSRHVVHFVDEREWTLTVATFASNYARTQWMTADLSNKELIHVLREVLRLRSLWLPPDHPDVVCSHHNLGVYLYLWDQKQIAKVHLKEYLKYATQDDSSLDPIPAISYILLIENEGKDDHLSIEVVRTVRALLEAREDFGTTNVEVASILNYIGTLLFHRRQLNEAILFYKHELEIEKRLEEATDRISISVTYNNIGRILQELGRLDEAIVCYTQALQTESCWNDSVAFVTKPTLSDDCMSAASNSAASNMSDSALNLYSTIWYNMGLIYDRKGSRTHAIVAFKTSLRLRKSLFGSDHPDVACLWYNLGTLQIECHQLSAAYSSLKEALRIKSMGFFQEDPRKISATLSRLAQLQEAQGLLQEAITTHHEILRLQPTSKDCVVMAMTLIRISELHHAQGKPRVALVAAQKSLNYALRSDDLFSSQSPRNLINAVVTVTNIMFLIGSLYHEMCEPDSASHTFRVAHGFVATVRRRLGGDVAAQLDSLSEALALMGTPSCAPQA